VVAYSQRADDYARAAASAGIDLSLAMDQSALLDLQAALKDTEVSDRVRVECDIADRYATIVETRPPQP